MLNSVQVQATYGQYASKEDPARVASHMYRTARARAWQKRLAAAIRGQSRRLLRLPDVCDGTARASHHVGIREVPIDRIRGSEGRVEGFDSEMWPTDGQSRARWVSIAVARQRGVQLPPVELIQVGDIYFVRDGHHRISVARTLGQAYIDAEVTAWEVRGLPHRSTSRSSCELVAAPA